MNILDLILTSTLNKSSSNFQAIRFKKMDIKSKKSRGTYFKNIFRIIISSSSSKFLTAILS